jgi:hypothetical protein
MTFREAANHSTAPAGSGVGTNRRGNIIKLAPAE